MGVWKNQGPTSGGRDFRTQKLLKIMRFYSESNNVLQRVVLEMLGGCMGRREGISRELKDARANDGAKRYGNKDQDENDQPYDCQSSPARVKSGYLVLGFGESPA